MSPLLSQAHFVRQLRFRLSDHLYDESGAVPEGIAIYSLSDPRDIRQIRYIGQTTAPRRRLLQHLSTARLWLPEDKPWWIQSPKLLPLYVWIRDVYRDEGRLPVMVVRAWTDAAEARKIERDHICGCMQRGLPLLNQAEVTPKRAGRYA